MRKSFVAMRQEFRWFTAEVARLAVKLAGAAQADDTGHAINEPFAGLLTYWPQSGQMIKPPPLMCR